MIKKRKNNNIINDRLSFLAVAIIAFAFLIVGKLTVMQIFQHDYYIGLAEEQHHVEQEVEPERGIIYLSDYKNPDKLYPYATNRTYWLVYANTNEVKYPRDIQEKLINVLNIEDEEDQDKVLQRLIKENDVYEPIKHKVTNQQKEELEKYELPGIHFVEENWRYYPEGDVGAHVLGFVGYTENGYRGQYGIEGYYDEELRGKSGKINFNKDASGRIIPTADREYEQAVDGYNLVLTIDRSLQFYACSMLKKHTIKYGAANGTVIIMEPKTGSIMAMCSYPTFDPNNYNEVESIQVYNNPAVFTPYEPGSVFKAITMAAALDKGEVTPDTKFNDPGEVKIDRFTIKNAEGKKYGEVNMTEVLENSINTGAIWIAQQLGIEDYRTYIENFGFGEPTGITLNTEESGNISSLYKRSPIYLATASYGQGITTTPIQLLSAFAAIANGGNLVKPYIVDRIIFDSGLVEDYKPVTIRQVISPKTSRTISAMLASVVESGHASHAAVPGYYIAGKTGTAQVANLQTGKYDESNTTHTFIGFAPIGDPEFVMLTKFDHPTNVRFAASSAAPLFGDIAAFLLNYLQIPAEK